MVREIKDQKSSKYVKLTPEEERVIIYKGTELPFSGNYNEFFGEGIYYCKRCRAPLFRSEDKFRSSCGWPSFEDEIKGAIKRVPDPDGVRIEIQCAACHAHLGHVFEGEGLTEKNVRHCVNSISLYFVPQSQKSRTTQAYFAGGCFWGLEYHFQQKNGVKSAVSGYMGGDTEKPTYEEVCTGKTGHVETVEVTYNPKKVSYEELARLFFEIHDPTQEDGQGPDIGDQYKSVIFYSNEEEKRIAYGLIDLLKKKDYAIQTKVLPVSKFWKAEEYHQKYYKKNKKKPYCHVYTKRF
jgi:peptide methionine sulfoxide reductase msrA/msrB